MKPGSRNTPRLLRFLLLAAAVGAAPAVRAAPATTAPDRAAQTSTAKRAFDRPLLWRIDGPSPSYVLGTIHLPDEALLVLPPVVAEALGAVDSVLTEIPMDGESIAAAGAAMLLPPGRSLRAILPAALYERIDRFFQKRGLTLALLDRFQVWALSVQIVLLDDLAALASTPPLDKRLYDLARERGRAAGGLETVAEQIGVFESFTEAENIRLLETTLKMMEGFDAKGIRYGRKVLNDYLTGDCDRLRATLAESYDPDDPLERRAMDRLITERDVRMADRIAARLETSPGTSYFFAVGAGHLCGDDGNVVARLRNKGLRITRLTPPDAQTVKRPVRKDPPVRREAGTR